MSQPVFPAYGLSWHGKAEALQQALEPARGQLRLLPELSLQAERSRHMLIEGDNLEVLRHLVQTHAEQVKLIYLDPPYNTGKRFVYEDHFQTPLQSYRDATGQRDLSGRIHTDWLNMMYPRLLLAHRLLRPDGVLAMSIDDGEVAQLKLITSELFGDSCFVAQIAVVSNPRGRHLNRFVAQTHDHLLLFVKDPRQQASVARLTKGPAMQEEYQDVDDDGPYRLLGLRNRNQNFNPQTRPRLYYPLYVDPETLTVSLERSSTHPVEVWPDSPEGVSTCWTWSRKKVEVENQLLVAQQLSTGWRIFRKNHLKQADGKLGSTLVRSVWNEKEFSNDYGRRVIRDLFGAPVMDFPKPVELLERILSVGCGSGGLVLDFFAGSGTTGHAVYRASLRGGPARQFILVQRAESTRKFRPSGEWEESEASRAGLSTLAELARERLCRASAQLAKQPGAQGCDLGFQYLRWEAPE